MPILLSAHHPMIIIRKFRKSDTISAALLIAKTYRKFNRFEFQNKSAFWRYLNYYNPRNCTRAELYNRFIATPICYVAIKNSQFIGVIRGTTHRIVNLYVDERYHHQGVGRRLLEKFETDVLRHKSVDIKVRSSLYAVSFYQHLGYRKTTGPRTFRGLRIQPMVKRLPNR